MPLTAWIRALFSQAMALCGFFFLREITGKSNRNSFLGQALLGNSQLMRESHSALKIGPKSLDTWLASQAGYLPLAPRLTWFFHP